MCNIISMHKQKQKNRKKKKRGFITYYYYYYIAYTKKHTGVIISVFSAYTTI